MSSPIIRQRMTARMDGEFCAFLIGMRINRPLKIHKWLPVMMAMPRMLRELQADKELGLLGGDFCLGRTIISLQSLRSFDHLTRMPPAKITNTSPHGRSSNAQSATAAMSASGTRHTPSNLAHTRRSTTTCRHSVSVVREPSSLRQADINPPKTASMPPRSESSLYLHLPPILTFQTTESPMMLTAGIQAQWEKDALS